MSIVTPDLLQQMRAAQAPMPNLPAAPVMPSAMSLPVPAAPLVSKIPTAMDLDQQRVSNLHTQGSGVDQINNPLLRGIARAGDIAASVFLPGIARSIPGTTLNHQVEIGRAQANLANDQATQKAAADTENVQSQASERESLGKKADALAAADTPMPITAELAQAAGAPQLEGISMSPKDYQRLVANHQTVQGRIQTNQATNNTRQSVSDDKIQAAAELAAEKPMNRDDHYIKVMEKNPTERTPEDLAFKQAYEKLIDTKTTQPGIQRAIAFGQNRPVQVIDPSSNNVVYQTAGSAMRSGAATPTSSDYQAGKALQKDFTSGTDAHTLTAFNTAQGHLKELAAASEALNNGDVTSLNSLANAYGVQTGKAAPVVFQAVKTALTGEIAKAFTGAGATVNEVNEVSQSINAANSPEQLSQVAKTYTHLLDTKKQALQGQLEAGKKGQANFGNQTVKKFNPTTGRLE